MNEYEIESFELDTISNIETGELTIKDEEKTFALARSILEEYQVPFLLNDIEKKKAKEIRAKFNKVIKAIDRRRIDTIDDFTREFTDKCNELKQMFVVREQAFKREIERYESEQKEAEVKIPVAKKYTATIKFNNEKLIEKLTQFCEKYHCELSIK